MAKKDTAASAPENTNTTISLPKEGPELEPIVGDEEPKVTVKITQKGHGKVHTGYVPEKGIAKQKRFHAYKDEITVPVSVGRALQDKGYAEDEAKELPPVE